MVVPGWTFISAVETVLCWQLRPKSPQGRKERWEPDWCGDGGGQAGGWPHPGQAARAMSWGSLRSTHPFPAPVGVSWAKGSPQPGPVPAGGRLPSGTSGWGHHSCREQEVMCWMLRRLPEVRTWGFFLPLRPFETPSALGVGWGCLALACPWRYPTPNELLLPAVGAKGAGKLLGSLLTREPCSPAQITPAWPNAWLLPWMEAQGAVFG